MDSTVDVELVRTGFSGFENNTYILSNSVGRCLLVDPAWDAATYQRRMAQRDLSCDGILITHYHYDHINLASVLAQELQVPIHLGRAESEYYGVSFARMNLLAADDTVQFGEHRVRALMTPGHTYGSICYLAGDYVFTGDTLFNEGCGNCVDTGSDAHALYHSMQRLRAVAPSGALVYPGHSYGSPPGRKMSELQRTNIYLQMPDEEMFVRFRMRPQASR